MDLKKILPQLLPQAVTWVEAQADRTAEVGAPLNEAGVRIARAVGVQQPDLIRIEFVDEFPLPGEQLLRDVAIDTGLLGPGMAGITFGHSVLIRRGHGSVRLFSHEFRHVHQYENFGSISAFLQEYLRQIAEFGYEKAPLELDAQNHELAVLQQMDLGKA